MIKYNDIIDNRKNYSFILKDNYIGDNVDVTSANIPLSFFIKYKDVLESINYTYNSFIHIDKESIERKLSLAKNYDEYMHYCELSDCIERIENDGDLFLIHEFNSIDFNLSRFDVVLSFFKRLNDVLIDCYPHNKEIYKRYQDRIKEALNEFSKYNVIKSNKN